ncbi:hypothetical protein FISHEDRAFT_73084 [Fistulina hepatica ATCC 64428]|uniref:Uncharacterized protein n=1 Tax=Fistulina hepatica ATCC 64428 TaxID=1128425 RepID=A0A0D7ADN5_9AGAR|nr:hypothetical protein FISHEDRAFT_73084 [Fistulina hepatica ATCC 64428]
MHIQTSKSCKTRDLCSLCSILKPQTPSCGVAISLSTTIFLAILFLQIDKGSEIVDADEM